MILEDIVNDDIKIIFKINDFYDQESGSFLLELVRNKKFFQKEFSNKNNDVTIDEYIKYLISKKVKKL